MNHTIVSLVRRHDPDRFLTALFAPPEHRDALLTLYAFDHELARAREVTSEPHLTLIRLHWWREVVEGARRRHEGATPLADLLDSGRLDPAGLAARRGGRGRRRRGRGVRRPRSRASPSLRRRFGRGTGHPVAPRSGAAQ